MSDEDVSDRVEAADAVSETHSESFRRLAALEPHEYEQCRKAEAKRLGMRAIPLDKAVASARPRDGDADDLGLIDPDPWPHKVDGADLLDRIVAALRRYIVMPKHTPEAVALWCLHAHAFDLWQHTPRLAIGAPERGCGKSLLLDVIACIVPRALQTDSLSEAVAFRLAESHRPTFLIDECDTHLSSKNPDDGLRGILNSGHSKGKRALRCVGDDNQVKGFATFTPVALAGIGTLPPTLADRSVVVVLQRRTADETVENFRSDRADHLRELASQCVRWVADHKDALRRNEPVMPEGIYNRRADVWRPLLAIADVAGGDWPNQARKAVVALEHGTDEAESITVQLFTDISLAFERRRDDDERHGDDKLPSAKLAEYLNDMEGRPWPEFGKSRQPITANQIARLLKRHGISPSVIRIRGITTRGYRLQQFENVFARYLPRFQPSQRNKAQVTAENRTFQSVTTDPCVTPENPENPQNSAHCYGVAVENGGAADESTFQGFGGDAEERAAIQEIDGVASVDLGAPQQPSSRRH